MKLLLQTLFLSLLLMNPAQAERFRFFAGGDAPYSRAQLQDLAWIYYEAAKRKPRFIVHVGDIKSGSSPCSDKVFERIQRFFRKQPMPVVFTPGDNDWTDCRRKSAGGHDPEKRLKRLRQLFYEDASVLKLEKLSLRQQQKDYPEHYRFMMGGVMFVSLHVVGSYNNRYPRKKRAMKEFHARAAAGERFLNEAFDDARSNKAKGIVLMFHANPRFKRKTLHPGYKYLLTTLTKQLADWKKPVLAIHGDDHYYLADQPLVDSVSGKAFSNFTRIQVPGNPQVDLVEINVDSYSEKVFHFDIFIPDL